MQGVCFFLLVLLSYVCTNKKEGRCNKVRSVLCSSMYM